jgi:iron complex transport system ATP-binding protein
MTEKAQPCEFLHLRGVNVAQGQNIVLHDVNLTIQRGEHAVILGPNGCGKSTLIQTMTCAIYPIVHPGMELLIYGRERWDLTELRKHFGVVTTDLPGGKTSVTSGLNATIAGFFSASTLWPNLDILPEMRERAWEALERMEATYLAERMVGHMSAGEKRRIMIARALVHHPEMLLLDEPSNALDLAAQRDLRRVLRSLAQQGTGILLVTHHLSDILPEIERVILMRDGRIFRDGHRSELLKPNVIGELFHTPVQIVEQDGYLYSY